MIEDVNDSEDQGHRVADWRSFTTLDNNLVVSHP
jgi:hypothetical protein